MLNTDIDYNYAYIVKINTRGGDHDEKKTELFPHRRRSFFFKY